MNTPEKIKRSGKKSVSKTTFQENQFQSLERKRSSRGMCYEIQFSDSTNYDCAAIIWNLFFASCPNMKLLICGQKIIIYFGKAQRWTRIERDLKNQNIPFTDLIYHSRPTTFKDYQQQKNVIQYNHEQRNLRHSRNNSKQNSLTNSLRNSTISNLNYSQNTQNTKNFQNTTNTQNTQNTENNQNSQNSKNSQNKMKNSQLKQKPLQEISLNNFEQTNRGSSNKKNEIILIQDMSFESFQVCSKENSFQENQELFQKQNKQEQKEIQSFIENQKNQNLNNLKNLEQQDDDDMFEIEDYEIVDEEDYNQKQMFQDKLVQEQQNLDNLKQFQEYLQEKYKQNQQNETRLQQIYDNQIQRPSNIQNSDNLKIEQQNQNASQNLQNNKQNQLSFIYNEESFIKNSEINGKKLIEKQPQKGFFNRLSCNLI